LAVDLDGTLIRSDLLFEGTSAYVTRVPLGVLNLVRWVGAGRDRLKVEVASRTAVEPATLPYRTDVLDWLNEERRAGRPLVLVSASDERQVEAVAEHLGIFESAFGTRVGRNLKARTKRDLLVEQFGAGGYDYIGDDRDDLEVWSEAHTAHVVGSKRFASRVAQTAAVGSVFRRSETGTVRLLVKAMRPHQWAKNLLIAVPLLTAQLVGDPAAVLRTVLAFVLFSLTASSAYLLNDIVDISNDRIHPEKRRRPFASGQLSLVVGWVAWPALALVSLGLALAVLPWEFAAILAAYYVLTLTYSFWAKRKGVLDVIVLGGLYTIRLIAGGAAIAVPLTMWLIAFSMLFFLSLALIKRVSELSRVRRTGGDLRGRGYLDSDLELLSSYGVASSIGSIVIFTVYLQDAHTRQMYAQPEILGFAIPILLAWLMRCWLFAHRGFMDEDPIVFAIKDPKSLMLGVFFVAVFVAANVSTMF
jgi:4-hydroxybenzoate polyprenyltransferase